MYVKYNVMIEKDFTVSHHIGFEIPVDGSVALFAMRYNIYTLFLNHACVRGSVSRTMASLWSTK